MDTRSGKAIAEEPDSRSALEPATARACSNARNAARCVSPVRSASIADSFRSGRHRRFLFRDGDLGLVDRTSRTATNISDPNERMRWHAMLVYIAHERGYKAGWAAHKFKEKFGTWPPCDRRRPIPPSPKSCPGFARATSPTPRRGERRADEDRKQQGQDQRPIRANAQETR